MQDVRRLVARDECTLVFTGLKNGIDCVDLDVAVEKIEKQTGKRLHSQKLHFILEVFKNLGLIDIEYINGNEISEIKLRESSTKAHLENGIIACGGRLMLK